MNFESSRDIESKRQDLREARQQYLEKAKLKYERDERKAELAKQRGEELWMLPALSDRLEREEQSLKKAKKKKKEKKKKKHKKKEKKKKRKESSSSSDSSSDEDEGPQWIEKGAKSKPEASSTGPPVKGPRLERDSWMEAPIDLFPTVTRKDLLDKKNKEKEAEEKAKELMDKPGLHAKELNPYWKDGGTGLPEESKEKEKAKLGPAGDGGLSWLRKAFQRCQEQAKEEGRSLEELAAERWGSLEKIQKMIRDAEACSGRGPGRQDQQKSRFMRPDDSRASASSSRSFQRPRSRSRSPDRRSNSGYDKSRSRQSDSYSDRRRKSRSRSRERQRRSRSRDRKERLSRSRSRSRERRHRRSRSRSKERRRRSRSHERQKQSRSRSRSRERQRRRSRSRSPSGSGSRSGGLSSMKGRFMKPGDMSDDVGRARKPTAAPAWRKKEFQKPVEEDDKSDDDRRRERRRKEDDRKHGRRRRNSSSDSSSSTESSSEESSSDSESEAEGERSRSQQSPPPPPPQEVRILTEKEMNDLGAKILRLEIMGNKDQAEKLKQQLEAAREAKKNAPAGGDPARTSSHRKGNEEGDDFVTLTKMDRSGLVRPVPDRQHPQEASGGKRRRKKQKVETHTGKTGERTKYFDDDDKFDLKTMVEREKMGTAEDQNKMFARLAGRAAEKTNDDFQVDDIFLSKANQKQSESVTEERDRAQAIFEHRKMAGALEKCHFCFNNVKKHLIIAIGTKVYLSLPETKSLTEGHCLIVPMQHVTSGTAVDEDVWSEIQVFRKCLVKMFAEREEDVVFLETSMHLKSFPHMSLHCVPMEREVGELAPIYFKKAIQETGSEWSQNKKLVDLKNRDVRHAVPKGFPYFAVDFGYQSGFAHVIEDEQKFPKYFGQEIIGGMIDADHTLWRRPPRENFDDQRKKVLQFAEMWKPHDWTQNISKKTNVDSDSD